MISNFKWAILIIGNSILIFLMQLVNHTLACVTIHISLFALFIFIPLLLLSFTSGLISVFITGFILDTSSNLPIGTTTLTLSIVYTAAFSFRHQFKAYTSSHNILILQSANAIIFAFLTVTIDPTNYSNLYYWSSILLNLFFSQLTLLFITPWFFNLQNSLLSFFDSRFKIPQKQISDPTNLNSG